MNPKKNYLFKKMIKISRRRYDFNKIKFNRIKDCKFIEDIKELEEIGNEIFHNFGLNEINIKLFLDICAAPGIYSSIILKDKKCRGIGVSLPIEKGGVEFINMKKYKYKIFFKDILEKKYRLDIPKKVDFGMASCVSYINCKKTASLINLELILTSLDMILDVLNKNGNLIINLTMKNIFLTFNIINILSKYFDNYNLWKSENIWSLQNTFYFFGYGFKNNYNEDIINIKNILSNKESKYYNKFIGKKSSFYKINKKMNEIYKVRIKSFSSLNK